MPTQDDPKSTVVDSKEKWQEQAAKDNEGKSQLLFDVLSDDDKAWGCKVLVMPGGPTDLCGLASFFRARYGDYAGQEICLEHAFMTEIMNGKCTTEECPYEGNYTHMDIPWDYECNAPAVDPNGGYCFHCSTQPRDRETDHD
jgi:hypothetical protein